MKAKEFYKVKTILIFTVFLAACLPIRAQDARKEITESYNVSKGVTVICDTKYSRVEFLNWDQDVVDILAELEVKNAASKARAEELLERIKVEIDKSGNNITLETDLGDLNSRKGKVTINVTVKIPSYANLDIENSYGDLFIQEATGLVLMDLKYTNIKADKLTRVSDNPVNQLKLAYSNGTIGEAGNMELELAYSDLEITSSRRIGMKSKYSKLSGEKAGTIVTEGAYDKYFLDEVDLFDAKLKYSGIKFGKLNRSMHLESGYTNVKIDDLAGGFSEVNADLAYGNIYIRTDPSASFKFTGESKYGKINMARDDNLNRSKENTNMKVWGNVGSSPKSTMNLVTKYGNIDVE